ncbi:MAG: polysaccharide pyruvyl transferase family protein [Ruminococcus sp.]|nr:polysaccharide pyruvyl transferase family protein [Ruminococcus sp.]
MKIGILTYHHAHNYGAYIQACALCNRLNAEPDIDCELIDFRMKKEVDFYSLSRISKKTRLLRPMKYHFMKEQFAAFEEALSDPVMKKSDTSIVSDSIDDFTNLVKGRYDAIITGSDEVWKTEAYRGFPTAYWLPGDLQCKKFAYAASSRSDFSSLPESGKQFIQNTLHDYTFIGVREQSTADQLIHMTDAPSKVHVCCDPSFLYDFPVRKASVPELLEGKCRLNPSKKTILLMSNERKLAFTILKNCAGHCNLVSVYNSHPGWKNAAHIKPLEWVELIANADLVITTYFHGTCLSIVNQTPFLTVGSAARDSKLISVFDETASFRDRYIKNTEALASQKNLYQYLENFMTPPETAGYVAEKRENFSVFLSALRS